MILDIYDGFGIAGHGLHKLLSLPNVQLDKCPFSTIRIVMRKL
jgi:hypothetical protein